MASNSFGHMFRITTWGESHGKAIGVVIDGCPAGLCLDENIINEELAKRAPGHSPYTSPRKEPDSAEIMSGVFDGKTTGAPIMIMIPNQNADSSKYEPIKHLMRPGHANFTYLEKYGIFDYRGGGRSSARETACRVAAGAVAKQLLTLNEISVEAYITQIGEVSEAGFHSTPSRCSENRTSQQMASALEEALKEGNSLGGVVEFVVSGLPAGFGDPVYEKLEANLGKAMLSIPATKGFEVGEGFLASAMRGSDHNDEFDSEEGKPFLATNHAGGLLGGISTGQPIVGRVAFKPASSIRKSQNTVDIEGRRQVFQLPEGSRHDPCVAIRAVPVVEAMAALVVVDALLMNRSARVV